MKTDVTPEHLAKIKEAKEQKQETARELRQEQVDEIKDIAQISKKEKVILTKDVALLNKLVDKKIEKERAKKLKAELKELNQDVEKVKTPILEDKRIDPSELIGENEMSLLEMAKNTKGVIKEDDLSPEQAESIETLKELGLVEQTDDGLKMTDEANTLVEDNELDKLAKDLADNVSESEKQKALDYLAENAENKVVDKAMEEAVGEETTKELNADRVVPNANTGNETLDKRLKQAVNQLTYDQAMELAQAREKHKKQKRTLDKKYKSRIKMP